MVNHSKGDADRAKKAQEAAAQGAAAVAIIGTIGKIVGGFIKSKKYEQEVREIQAQIADIDREIADYRSKFLGEIMYADEIEELEAKREELRKRI